MCDYLSACVWGTLLPHSCSPLLLPQVPCWEVLPGALPPFFLLPLQCKDSLFCYLVGIRAFMSWGLPLPPARKSHHHMETWKTGLPLWPIAPPTQG